jgi:hypothetical protein
VDRSIRRLGHLGRSVEFSLNSPHDLFLSPVLVQILVIDAVSLCFLSVFPCDVYTSADLLSYNDCGGPRPAPVAKLEGRSK